VIELYKTYVDFDDELGPRFRTDKVDELEEGSWVNVVEPTAEDRAYLVEELGIVEEFVKSAFDDEETSHVDFDETCGQTLVIVDCPAVEDEEDSVDQSIIQFDTHPLAILFLQDKDLVVTVSLRANATIRAACEGRMRDLDTSHHARMLLQLLLHISQQYLIDLRSINRQFRENERKLRHTMRNSDLMKMLGFEKSLVYFSTSLRALDTTIARIGYGRVVALREDDRALLDDVSIEVKQAIEMCGIYSNVISETMETVSSLINNNLNDTMRILAIITLVLSVPTIIYSFYGMNTPLPLDDSWVVPLIISILASLLALIWLKKSRAMHL
jgi:magnesium transporter